ncbi:hypothetical protein [Propionivibrio dicarboxylicus]|uniref:Uncharacterized protein n=1 Tax=Propionivibrio dicarboxylicus TaxID=83767 RepID=A0A1G8KQS0_9RHOO|nr:hypothetical protein [Propionivibrio dicarboxylicus]SDI45805.1 hypothetical protein SAMN05660652_03471 [Propionivibrio dicarboxylicus]
MKRDFLKRSPPAAPIVGAAKIVDDDVLAADDAGAVPRLVAATQRCSHWSPVIPPQSPTSRHH